MTKEQLEECLSEDRMECRIEGVSLDGLDLSALPVGVVDVWFDNCPGVGDGLSPL